MQANSKPASVVIRILPLILILSCPVISGWELSRASLAARKASEVSSCCSVVGLKDGASRRTVRDAGDAPRRHIWGAENAPVAQLDRASGFEPEGWGFKSLRARHSFLPRAFELFFMVYFSCFLQARVTAKV